MKKLLTVKQPSFLLGLDQVYYWRCDGKNIIVYTNMDVTLFRAFNHMIIMMRKVDLHAEKGILIMESSFKVIDMR
jgi:hypothetical protein